MTRVSLLHRCLLIVAFFMSSTFLLPAQMPIPTQRPTENLEGPQVREIVSKYCRLDYEGGRLDPQMWPKFEPIVWWKTAPDFTQINVIARYTVEAEPVSNHGKYTVTVHYRLLGTYDLVTGYVPEPPGATQDVDFLVTSDNSEFRIGDAENTYPHPSKTAMVKWLNDKISTTTDEATKTRLQNALTQLSAQSGSPFGK
jgi:hypothetical protein